MIMTNGRQVFLAHQALLQSRQQPFKVKGVGPYMFIQYDADFKRATIARFCNMDALFDSYHRAFNDGYHVEINNSYLKIDGSLSVDEQREKITPHTNRLRVHEDGRAHVDNVLRDESAAFRNAA